MGAQSAISDALLVANSANGTNLLRQKQGKINAVTGVMSSAYSDQGIKWRWYTERVTGASATSKYFVYATGYRESPDEDLARTLRVTLTSVANSKGKYDATNKIINYTPLPDAISQWGIMGASSVDLNNGAQVYSYISDNGTSPSASTNQGSVASNGNITLGGAAVSLNILNVLNYSVSTPNRCVGNADKCNSTTQNKITYSTNLLEVSKKIKTACPNPAISYPVYKSSEQGGVITPGCYNSVIFDTDTSISASYTESNPANVYVKGNIEVAATVDVNTGKDPLALRIFSEGGTDAVFNQGTVANPTKFYGVVLSSTLKCTDLTTSASPAKSNVLMYYGGLVCDKLNFGYGTSIWWDELSGELTQAANVTRIWYVDKTEEIY